MTRLYGTRTPTPPGHDAVVRGTRRPTPTGHDAVVRDTHADAGPAMTRLQPGHATPTPTPTATGGVPGCRAGGYTATMPIHQIVRSPTGTS